MTKKKIDDVELLLSKLDKKQLTDFIRKECANKIGFLHLVREHCLSQIRL